MNVDPFLEAETAQQRNVKRACELLEVSRAASYAHRAGVPRHASAPTPSSPGTSAKPTRRPRAAMVPRASTRSCAVTATGTPASAWPGWCALLGCTGAPHADGGEPRSPIRRPPPGWTW